MAEMKTYTGGCHCGKVRYEATLSLDKVISCNCSICSKRATLLAFTPIEQFKLLSGEDALTDYQFNTRSIHHLFCRHCGIASFSRGTPPRGGGEMAAINVRCLDDVDVAALTVTQVDGKSF